VNAQSSLAPREFADPERELHVLPDASELQRARTFADAAAERFGLGARERYDFKLAANEAVANAIEHGRACSDGTIHISISERPRGLTLCVRDAGAFVPAVVETDATRDRGRGFNMMSDLVDVLALSRVEGHTQVELTKHRRLSLLRNHELL
jgi:anti-sigma regulatory factor (Ser/Thr protein kinase)